MLVGRNSGRLRCLNVMSLVVRLSCLWVVEVVVTLYWFALLDKVRSRRFTTLLVSTLTDPSALSQMVNPISQPFVLSSLRVLKASLTTPTSGTTLSSLSTPRQTLLVSCMRLESLNLIVRLWSSARRWLLWRRFRLVGSVEKRVFDGVCLVCCVILYWTWTELRERFVRMRMHGLEDWTDKAEQLEERTLLYQFRCSIYSECCTALAFRVLRSSDGSELRIPVSVPSLRAAVALSFSFSSLETHSRSPIESQNNLPLHPVHQSNHSPLLPTHFTTTHNSFPHPPPHLPLNHVLVTPRSYRKHQTYRFGSLSRSRSSQLASSFGHYGC